MSSVEGDGREQPARERRGPAWRLAALVLLFLLPLGLRVASIDHGGERNYLADTHVVRCALGMAQDKHPVPPVGKYSSYPYLIPYMLLPIYVGQYGVGKVSGEWDGAKDFANHVKEHPAAVHHTARWLVALLGALTVCVVYRTGRSAGLPRGAWVAAWLVATGLLHLHFSVQERPWVPLTFFIALGGWASVKYTEAARARHLWLCAVAVGLAFATHQAGGFATALVATTWLCGPLGWTGRDLGRRAWTGVVSVVLFFGVALALGHPYLLLHGATDTSAVIMGEEAESVGGMSVGGQAFYYAFRWESVVRLTKAFFGYDPLLFVLALLGLPLAVASRALRPVALFALFWAGLFFTNHNDHVRYLVPLCALFALPAGALVERLPRRAAPLVAVLLALPLIQALRFDAVMGRRDVRAQAEDELFQLGWEDLVAIDVYGPLVPPDAQSLRRTAGLRELYGREQHRLSRLESGDAVGPEWGGVNSVRIEDLFLIDNRSDPPGLLVREAVASRYGEDPRGVLRALGVTHLLLVDRKDEPDLMEGWVEDADLVRQWSPGPGPETSLPTEMDFALTGIWRVSRPGPRMRLYRLAP